MLWLKACSRCNGDLYEDRDVFGRYIACLQCGHYLIEAEEVALRYSSRMMPGASSVEVPANSRATVGSTAA